MIDFALDDIRRIISLSLDSGPTGDSFLDIRYEHHRLKYGHHWPYYRTFYLLAAHLKPSLIVELGGWQGTAAAHFANGNPDTAVVSIDHHTDPGDEHNQSLMLAAQDRYSNLKYIQGWTTEMLANREKGRHARGDAPNAYSQVVELGLPIDILFVDSWHRYDEAMDDWNTYSQILASPSLVICDDIQAGGDEHSPIQGMLDFWSNLPGEKFLENRIHPGSQMGFIKYV